MWKPTPSAISVNPIISRNDSASTFTVGWRMTKSPIVFAENIMMATATTTAAIMIEMSLAMPTAVMTESSEKMMSSSMIWPMTAANDGATFAAPCASSPSSLS